METARNFRGSAWWAVRLSACLPMAAAALAQSGGGQAEQIADTPLDQLGNVRVYSVAKHLQTLTEAPSFVTVITGDQIRKYGYRTLAEVLQSVAGFYVDYDRNYTYVGVRGFARSGDYNSRILVLLDGHRMNDNVYDGAYFGTEFPLDLALVERVEVARGPSAALYGTNAFFAVVNVVTVSPERRHGVEVSFDTGSFGTYSGSARMATKLADETHLLISGTAYESAGPSPLYVPAFDTPETNHGMAVNVDDDSLRSLFLTVTRPNLRLQGFYSERRKGIPTGAYETLFNDPRSRTLDRRSYANVEYSRPLNERWSVSARTYFDYYGYKGSYAYAGDEDAVEIEKDYAVGTWWGSDLQARASTWKKHSLTLGGEFRINLRQDQGAYNLGDPSPLFLDARNSHNWAVYVQDEYAIAKPLVLYLGLRHDRYSQFGGTTNPRIGAVYRPWINTAIKLIYGTAFRAPNAWELYYNATPNIGNPFLKPEKIRTLELLAEHTFAGVVRVTGSAFSNRISDLINQHEEADGNFMFRNLGRVSARGLEAQVEATHNEYQARISYTFQQTRDQITGAALSNSPKHLAKLNFIAPVKPGRLFAGVEALYTARRTTTRGEPVGGFAVVNLTAFAPRLARNLDLSFSVFNLFDRRYADPCGDEQAGPVIQDGRTVRLKLTYRF